MGANFLKPFKVLADFSGTLRALHFCNLTLVHACEYAQAAGLVVASELDFFGSPLGQVALLFGALKAGGLDIEPGELFETVEELPNDLESLLALGLQMYLPELPPAPVVQRDTRAGAIDWPRWYRVFLSMGFSVADIEQMTLLGMFQMLEGTETQSTAQAEGLDWLTGGA